MTRTHNLFAARFLDFAVLTAEHLVLCSTGFFTRRPRRQVFREALSRLEVLPLGGEPAARCGSSATSAHPIRLELRPNEAGLDLRRASCSPAPGRATRTPGPDATPA